MRENLVAAAMFTVFGAISLAVPASAAAVGPSAGLAARGQMTTQVRIRHGVLGRHPMRSRMMRRHGMMRGRRM